MGKPKTYVYHKDALAARINRYGGDLASDLNGALVELGPYLPDVGPDKTPWFDVHLVMPVKEGNYTWQVGDMLLASVHELVPLTEAARAYIKNATDVDTPVYLDEVYDLRDLLGKAGVNVTAASLAKMTPAQRERIFVWAKFVVGNPNDAKPAIPKELLP